MRVLDIDLDFFLDKIAYDNRSNGTRLIEDEFKPWSKEEFRGALETQIETS